MAKCSKYGARKCRLGDLVFDSTHERTRWQQLLLLEASGEITGLKRQVKYELIPAQFSNTEKTKKGNPKCIERAVSYIADFTYEDESGQLIVEDAKGFKTTEYRIKKKLMLLVHWVEIKEV